LKGFIAELEIDPPRLTGAIDSAADEEMFRRGGYQAITAALAQRWEEADGPVIMQCTGCRQTMKPIGGRKKDVHTICGTVVVKRRKYYCAKCERTIAPLDRRLGIDETGITPGMMRLLCRTALELAYKKSESLLTDILGFRPCSAREIERIANKHGEKLEERISAGNVGEITTSPRCNNRKYCLMIDAAMIPGLPDPVEHKLTWHDVKLAVGIDPTGVHLPFYVAGREDVGLFGKRLWHHLQSHGLDVINFCLILGDGAHWIWTLADLLFPKVRQLLDFYHAAQHLYATAKLIFPEAQAQKWWHTRLAQLKAGDLVHFFQALKRSVKVRPSASSEDKDSPEKLLDYFVSNKSRLDYPWAIRNELPIGTGAVESACRHIPQQRLKQSGMRWSDPGAQSILNLRALHRNGEFEQYWEDFAASGF
jgi:hypothetical protein